MQFTKPITDIIKQRISVRTYTQTPIDLQKETKLKEFLALNSTGPLQTRLRFEVLTARPGDAPALKGLGTYGQITHPAGFIIGAMEAGPKNLEDFGYALEKIILFATDLDLGTCWLGGSFQPSNFAKAIGVQPGETVPAAISIGYPAEKPSLRDSLVRLVAKPRQRLPWEQLFFDQTFTTPLTQEQAGSYAIPLEMVHVAPSASNHQPWRIIKDAAGNRFHFYLQRTPGYNRSESRFFKMADLQRIDMGIAMCHFELAAREQGLQGTLQIADPGLRPLPKDMEYVVSWNAAS